MNEWPSAACVAPNLLHLNPVNSQKMKLVIFFAVVSAAVMAVMVFQTLRQELNLRNMRERLVENTMELRRKEDSVVEMKNKILELKDTLEAANSKLDILKKKKEEVDTAAKEADDILETCNSEKVGREQGWNTLQIRFYWEAFLRE